ncbi:transposable element Tc1 transposase [Trichonephila clavipes]|uniref:Transposable element Tc1 transposase n=1 Tax=Trichonephila clavipes TaxID=2585209 RepID=A0A8X6VYA3_TRICX|nr:transposable element Tc1 transposase [Trichonephila clavipes]
MENRKETTIEERKLVIKLSNEGKSQQNIAKVVGRSVNCIQKILQKFKKTASTFNNLGRYVSAGTVRRVLRKAGYNGRVARKKALNCDESKFNIFGSDGRRMVWRKPNTSHHPKYTIPTAKHAGGSVMVWGRMTASGVGKLVFIDGIMHKMAYLNILQNNLKESADKLGLVSNFPFQQDNDPEHTAFGCKSMAALSLSEST